MKLYTSRSVLRAGLLICVTAFALASHGEAQTRDEQAVLGPGLYVFQTRIISATCGDASRTGYVRSYYAAIDGIPGSATVQMRLLNSDHWSVWTLGVAAHGHVSADATLNGSQSATAPRAHFDLAWQRDKFAGRGIRTYRSEGRECTITYDALLRQIDR